MSTNMKVSISLVNDPFGPQYPCYDVKEVLFPFEDEYFYLYVKYQNGLFQDLENKKYVKVVSSVLPKDCLKEWPVLGEIIGVTGYVEGYAILQVRPVSEYDLVNDYEEDEDCCEDEEEDCCCCCCGLTPTWRG